MEVNTAIEKHAGKIVKRLAISEEEQEEMKIEFISHLQATKNDFQKEGYSVKEAEKLAISHFGKPEKVADEMHDAVFPHRKLLFLTLAAISLITAFGTYLVALFAEGDAHYGALVTAILSSTTFLVLSEAKYPRWERKRYLITLLVIHALLFLYQSLVAGGLTHLLQLPLSVLAYTVLLFAIVLIYRVALTGSRQKEVKILHGVNITIGLVFASYSLFFLWAMLAFGGIGYIAAAIIGIPITVWIIAYVLQVQFMKHGKKKAAYTVLALFGLLSILAIARFLMGMMPS